MDDMRRGLERVIGRPASGRKREWPQKPFARIILGKITRSDIYNLRRSLSKDPGGRVGQQAFQAVKIILSEAYQREDIPDNPAVGIGVYKRPAPDSGDPHAKRRRDAFDLQEYRLLWRYRWSLVDFRRSGPGMGRQHTGAAPDYRRGMALAILLAMGTRVSELRALRWRHIDLTTGHISIVEAFKGQLASSPIEGPKWGKKRPGLVIPDPLVDDLVWYHADMAERSETLVDQDVFVIPNPDGGPVGASFIQGVWSDIRKISEDAINWNDRWLTPHSCRHTLNTWLLILGAPPIQVQTFLGWESDAGKALATMQQHYGHLDLAGTRQAAAQVSKILLPDRQTAENIS
jgi:integrase